MPTAKISYAKYGKDNVRVLKVIRDTSTSPPTHTVAEFTVKSMLEGDIDSSYTQADNSVVVPTDTQKQSAYILAKEGPVLPVELYAARLAQHFIDRYKHLTVARVDVVQHRWFRMQVAGAPHPHSFARDGSDTRVVNAVATRDKGISLRSSIKGLLVLKSTGSAFYGYDTADSYTVLKPTQDRILSTEVDAGWTWTDFGTLAEVQAAASAGEFDGAYDAARRITLETFAVEESPSVQNTMYKMCEQILAAVPKVKDVDYTLPNKHYFEIDLSWHEGLANTGKDAEVYAPQSDPNGLIHVIVSR